MGIKKGDMCCISFDSYIKPQLSAKPSALVPGCISFDSYIKPQLSAKAVRLAASCISFDSYIKPQLLVIHVAVLIVVYLLIPTSNHNSLQA